MIITSIVISIESDGEKDTDMQPKQFVMNGNHWKMPDHIFARDIQLLSDIQLLVNRYNGRTR